MAGIRKPPKLVTVKKAPSVITRLRQRLVNSQTERLKYKQQLAKVKRELEAAKKTA